MRSSSRRRRAPSSTASPRICRYSGAPPPARSFAREFDAKIATLQEGAVELPVARHPKLASAGHRVALVKGYLLLCRVNRDGSVGVAHVFRQSLGYARLVAEI